MPKTLLAALFWCVAAAFMLDNSSLSPPLAAAQYGAVKWRPEGRAVVRDGMLPAFILYGHAALNEGLKPVVVKADFLEWAEAAFPAGKDAQVVDLFATGLPGRPFATAREMAHDAGLSIHLASARVNEMFLFWAFLSALLYFWLTTEPNYVLSPQERWRRDEYFRQKVSDLEIDYKNKPEELRARTAMLAFLGYGVVFGSIALIAGLGLGLAASVPALTPAGKTLSVLMGLIPAGFALKLLKSLTGQRGSDSGVRMSPQDAPALFSLLDKIRRKAMGPPFERVFIDMEMNAGVSRHTGLRGIFGFGPITLTLGLPLMQSLSAAQLAGVIGHEYGHVAARDNALGQWIYRIRNSWIYLGENLKTEHLWYVLRLDRFYLWFIGIFNAYSFTLSRQCEYEADAFAAKIAGAKQISEALVAMEVRAGQLRQPFWEDIWKNSELLPEPAGTPYRKLGDFFKQHGDIGGELAGLGKAATGHDSTHPALADRLASLGKAIVAPEPLKTSAAEKLLGSPLEKNLATLFDNAWRKHSRKAWKERHKAHQAALKTLDFFKGRKLSALARDELSEMIAAADTLREDKKIMAACQEILRREPENTAAKTHLLGFRLTRDGDESALLQLDELAREHPENLPAACRFAIRYFTQQARGEEAKVYQFRLDEWSYRHRAAEDERQRVYATDIFLPHNIKPEYVKKLAGFLTKYPVVGAAWLARKEVKYMKETPLFVIGLRLPFWRRKNGTATAREMQHALAQAAKNFPPYFRFFWMENVKGLEARLKNVRGAGIYRK